MKGFDDRLGLILSFLIQEREGEKSVFSLSFCLKSSSNQSGISQRAIREQSESYDRAMREESDSNQRVLREYSEIIQRALKSE